MQNQLTVVGKKPLSSTPGCSKKIKVRKNKALDPDEVHKLKFRKVDKEASESMKIAVEKIFEAATLIVNCMTELRPKLKALSNRNYREIQMSTNAVKQLVSILIAPKRSKLLRNLSKQHLINDQHHQFP